MTSKKRQTIRNLTLSWVNTRRRDIRKFASKYIAGTICSIEEVQQMSYLVALEATDLWIRKNGAVAFEAIFWTRLKFEIIAAGNDFKHRIGGVADISDQESYKKWLAENYDDSKSEGYEDLSEISTVIERLSKTEKNIVNSLCRGLSRDQIARDMNVKPHTVEVHLNSAIRKIRMSG